MLEHRHAADVRVGICLCGRAAQRSGENKHLDLKLGLKAHLQFSFEKKSLLTKYGNDRSYSGSANPATDRQTLLEMMRFSLELQ